MNKTEKYYKKAFTGFEYKTSGTVWRRMKWRLLWINFKFYILGASAVAITGIALYFGLSNPEPVLYSSFQDPFVHSVDYQTTVIHSITNTEYLSENSEPSIGFRQISNREQPGSISLKTVKNQKSNLTENVISKNTSERYPEINYANGNLITENTENTENKQAIVKCGSRSILFNDNRIDHPELIYDSIQKLYIPDKKTSFSLALYVSPAYNMQNLKADNLYQENLNYRNAQESPDVSLSAGIDVQFHIKNWYIQTGIDYSKFSSSRNYNHTFLAYDSLRSYYEMDTTWAWVYDPPDFGKPIPIAIDSVLIPVYNDINEGHNEWNYLEIPLLAGYKYNRGRFSVDIATGVSFGFLLNAKGNIPSLNEKNIFTDLSKENNLINQNQFNYILQLGVSYHITPDWSIMVKPFYKQNLKSVFKSGYPVDQRFSVVGINVGLIVDL